MSFGMPAEDICIRKLNKKNPEFCSVKYSTEKAEKAKVADPEKMRISQLKAILAEHGVKCTGCLEKSGKFVCHLSVICHHLSSFLSFL